MSAIDRRSFLRYMGLAATLPIVSRRGLQALSSVVDEDRPPVASLGTVNVQLTWLKDQTFLGDYCAQAKGFWTKWGLTVKLVAGGGSIDPLVPVVAGKAFTSAPSASSVASAIDKGAELTIFATDTQKQPSAIVSPASKPIITPEGMVGKKIGVNEATLVIFDAFLASNKLSSSQMKILPYNYDTSILTDGSVDALYGYSYDEPVTLGLAGFKTHTLLFSDYNYNVINNAWTVQSSALTNTHQRAQLVALMAGLVQGWTEVIQDPTGLIPGLLNTYCHDLAIKPSLGIATEAATAPLITGGGPLAKIYGLTPQLVSDTIAGLARQKVKLTEASFDMTFMEEVRAHL